MPVSAECPHCRARYSVPDTVGERKVRCPRCRQVFQPSAPPVVELVSEDEAVTATAPPRPKQSMEPRRSRELIPPPSDGTPVKKVPGFVLREMKGAVIVMVVLTVMSAITMGIIGLLVKWWWPWDKMTAPIAPPVVQQQKLDPQPPPQPAKALQAKPAEPQAPPAPPQPQSAMPIPAKPAPKQPAELKPTSQPRDRGPVPAYEEWSVLDEQKLEQKDGIWNAAISADGKTLATASNKFLKLWDLSANPPKEKASLNIRGRSTALRFAPDGKTLYLGLPDHTLRLLDVSGPRITERLRMKDWDKNVWYVTFSPDSKTLAVGADDMTVWLYDVTGDKPKEKTVFRVEKTTFGVKELFFTPDGKRIILGTGEGAVRMWDVAAKEPKELTGNKGESDTFLLPMALSPDGKILAVARRKAVHMLDVAEDGFTEWMKLDKHSKPARAVNFSSDGKLLATGGQDGKIMLWKVGLDEPILIKQRAGAISEVLFVPKSKDVRLIACNWNTGAIYLFKVGR